MATFNGRNWTVADMLPFKYVENWDDFFDDVIAEMEARSTGVGSARDQAVAAAAAVTPAVPIVTSARDQAVAAANTAASIVKSADVTERAGMPPCLDWLFTSAAAVPSGVITGTSGKWVRGQSGLWTFVPAGIAPIEYGMSGDARGIRVESAVPNPILYPSDFSNVAWTKSGSGTVTPDAKVAPDGTLTADLLSDTDSGTDAAYWQQIFTIANDTSTRCLSTFLAQGTAAASEIRAFLVGGSVPLSAGVVAKVTWSGRAVTGSPGAVGDEDANGFLRLSVPITNNGTGNTTLIVRVYPATNATGVTGTAYAWHAQIDPGDTPSSIIPGATTGAVARSADVNVRPLSQVPGWNPSEGTIYGESRTAASLPSSAQVLVQYDDGSFSNRLCVYRNTFGEIHCIAVVGGSNSVNLNLGVVANNTDIRVAFSWKAGSFAASLNGAAAVTAVTGALPAGLTTKRVGNETGSYSAWASTIRRDVLFPRALPAASLPILTA